MNLFKYTVTLAALAAQAFAAETLFSNLAFMVAPGSSAGKLYVFSRGDVASGMTELTLKATSLGVTVENSKQLSVGDTMTTVQDSIFIDTRAERRRIPATNAGDLGLVFPMYGLDNNKSFAKPVGIFSARSINRIVETPLDNPSYIDELESPMETAATGFSYDSSAKILWIARGAAGVSRYDISQSVNNPDIEEYLVNKKNSKFQKVSLDIEYSASKNPSIHDVKIHPQTRDLWLATEKGLWIKSGETLKVHKSLDTTKRVTGIWMGGEPFQIIVETSKSSDEGVQGTLWRSTDSKNFKKVKFLDTTGTVQKKDIFENSNYTVSDIAFLGNKAFIGVSSTGGKESGYLLMDSTGIQAWETDDSDGSQWLNGFEKGVTDRDVIITSITTFPLSSHATGIAVGTYGNGISVSADSGATWTSILNRAKLGADLGTIRMVPSVISEGEQSLVSYKVSKSSKITIDVFSYDMRKVRTIVKDASREADKSRSTFAKEDFWDGKDKNGRYCTMGVYYVRVKDNHGNIGWGKVMTLGGR